NLALAARGQLTRGWPAIGRSTQRWSRANPSSLVSTCQLSCCARVKRALRSEVRGLQLRHICHARSMRSDLETVRHGDAWHALCSRLIMTSNPLTKHPSRSPFHELTLKQRARVMRHSPTESEAALWRLLKGVSWALVSSGKCRCSDTSW